MSKGSRFRQRRTDLQRFGAQRKKLQNLTSEESIRQRRESIKKRKGIWWLASYPKSGNTWVRYMLECYFGCSHTTIQNMTWIRDDIRHADYQSITARPCDKLSDQEHLLLRPAMLHKRLVEHFDTRPFILKTHNRMDAHPEYVAPPWLTFGGIYLIRDPRDVVVSMSKHNGTTINETINQLNNENSAIQDVSKPRFKHYLGTWSMHVNSWLTQDYNAVIGLKYEEILINPSAALIEILKFIDIEIDEDEVDRVVKQATFSNMKKQEDERGFNEAGDKQEKFFNKGKQGTWKDILTDKQEKKIVEDHQEVMKRFDYI